MPIEYVWKIDTCEHEVATGGITVAHWRVTATEDTFVASAYGTCGFTPNAEDPDFKPYDELTEEEVLTWVWASVDKEAAEDSLAIQIDAQKNPVTSSGLPWA